MMIQRTWKYGTKHRGKVIDNMRDGRGKLIQYVQDLTADGEGHLLVAGAGDINASIGDEGDLEFVKGGPTGGYWKFSKDEK